MDQALRQPDGSGAIGNQDNSNQDNQQNNDGNQDSFQDSGPDQAPQIVDFAPNR